MNIYRFLLSGFISLLLVGVGIATVGASNDTTVNKEQLFLPDPPSAKADTVCVQPVEEMRRWHGLYLKHQRHDTMNKGIRNLNYSLSTCINCHVTPNAEDKYPDIHEGNEHFCRSCHEYASVAIDCFQCHAGHPDHEDHVNEESRADEE
ncbi:MAG: hypothetical protein KAH84_02250 [Thiomargarita sp.]|nr:hypothetical protein [Thiomargarita sp.]